MITDHLERWSTHIKEGERTKDHGTGEARDGMLTNSSKRSNAMDPLIQPSATWTALAVEVK